MNSRVPGGSGSGPPGVVAVHGRNPDDRLTAV
jgi:hypothetical protein